MNTNTISIKKLSALLVKPGSKDSGPTNALTLNSEMMRLGYIMSKPLFDVVCTLSDNDVKSLYKSVIKVLKSLKGDDVRYVPMYPNFPKQVMDASLFELYTNAINHYWSFGTWKPSYNEDIREIAFEAVDFKTIDLCTSKDIDGVFTTLLSSNSSITEEDKEILKFFVDKKTNRIVNCIPKEIPFKENLCFIAGELLSKKISIVDTVSTSTDVLRLFAHLSGGDVSLATQTRFKSLPRRTRRQLCVALERVVNEDDIVRHKNRWVKAFHSLHIGDFRKTCPKSYKVAQKIRNNTKIVTFNSKVESAIARKDVKEIASLLESRPGDFARRLDHVLRTVSDPSKIINTFDKVADKVSTRVLVQLKAHLNSRVTNNGIRVAYPKGSMQKAVLLRDLPTLDSEVVSTIVQSIDVTLVNRFKDQDSLGNVWIDSNLINCPIPLQLRSASPGLVSVARGTRLPIKKGNNTLRFFIYWVGQDIDLSASLHDENFNMVGHISYTSLKSADYNACHSGDITRAPNGAAEFIDITINEAAKCARYVVMNVYVYSGPTFAEHDRCYAGWMTKRYPDKGDIFDPKLIEQKIDLTSSSKNAIPIVFDLKTREAIWTDLATKKLEGSYGYSCNNIENNKASSEDTLKAIVLNNMPSLYELFELHALARGNIVYKKEDADTVFSLDEGITPFDVDNINANYLL